MLDNLIIISVEFTYHFPYFFLFITYLLSSTKLSIGKIITHAKPSKLKPWMERTVIHIGKFIAANKSDGKLVASIS